MIDFGNLESYRENNRIEAKKALGGFPQSVWETYSAFANTLGGVILLGVIERPDHSLHAVGLPDPDKLIGEFWNTVNDPEKVNANVLADRHVSVEVVDGKRIIAITVPRAHRFDKPIYIGGNPFSGAYRRNGEGDYRCTKEEVEAMLRDAAVKTQDMLVLGDAAPSSLDYGSVRRYRAMMEACRPRHVWNTLGDDEFLYKLGAVGRGDDGKMHPTAAGLLMFGIKAEILNRYPRYLLEYRQSSDCGIAETITSAKGDWSGNIFDFYLSVSEKLAENCAPLTALWNGDASPVYEALKEALANCLINADYYGRQGIRIIRERDSISFSNPGGFRIDLETAKAGGVSDPRNGALIKIFNLVDVGSGTGSGLPHIYSVWEKRGWVTPSISESFDPDRITLHLSIGSRSEKTPTANSDAEALAQKAAIIDYLTDHAGGTGADLCKLLGVESSRIFGLLADLIAAGIVACDGIGEGRTYRLKR